MTYADAICDVLSDCLGMVVNERTMREIESQIVARVWGKLPYEYQETFRPRVFSVSSDRVEFSVARVRSGLSMRKLETFLNETEFPA